MLFFFFFQAEDGIRDLTVTGVQTCALPICVSGALGVVTESAGAKMGLFVTAATVIAAGAVPGDATLPRPKSSRSFPAAITGTTPAAAVLRAISIVASGAGSDSGPPPAQLITFMPAATADSNAATISGVFTTFPIGVGTVKTR